MGGVRGGEVGGGGGRTDGRGVGCKKRGCRRKRPSVPRRNSPSLRVVFPFHFSFLTSRLTSTQSSADVCERQSSLRTCHAVRDSVIAAEQQRRRFDSRECIRGCRSVRRLSVRDWLIVCLCGAVTIRVSHVQRVAPPPISPGQPGQDPPPSAGHKLLF